MVLWKQFRRSFHLKKGVSRCLLDGFKMFIDTHCHISKEYYENIDEIINRMGNNLLIISGADSKSNKEVIGYVNKYKNVYGTIGIHPSEITDNIKNDLKFIEENISNPKIVGIGEIGLDYYYDTVNKEKQMIVFKEQIKLANKYNKTIVIHSREAAMDTYNTLKENNINSKVVIHCFSYSYEMAKQFISLGSLLGIGGVLTFKNSLKLKEIVKNISLDSILLETDSPYLSPEPNRGKQNEPINVIYVAKKIAEIKKIDVEKVYEVTTKSAISQFDLDVVLWYYYLVIIWGETKWIYIYYR